MTEEQKERNRLWVQALRSGNIKQCHCRLAMNEARCCLGVARDIFIEHTNSAKELAGLDIQALPSLVVKDWFGWDTNSPILDGIQAITRNDTLREDFQTIADAIEKEFQL